MASAERSEADLVRQARDGDLDAFAELVRLHEPRLRVVLLRVLDDARDVEESVQDAFVHAWRHLEGYRGEAAFFTWLYRIGVNAALARARRERRRPAVAALQDEEGVVDDAAVRPDEAAEARDLRERLVTALRGLPFDYREAVVLRDVAGLTNDEVAEALGVSVAAAKSRIHRGRLRLREALEELERG
ncbi:MAG TPA: sigma-70 family RNA polymerase sigma factor [Gaiellaceae bacterium]|nr:sigma-70 family RNA polymerase sigma factor [Gaiellaceae bacterium]